MQVEDHISNLERDKQWQLTAKDENGKLEVIMRGCPSDPHFKSGYYVWGTPGTALPLVGLRNRLDTGKLKLLRGTIPDAEAA